MLRVSQVENSDRHYLHLKVTGFYDLASALQGFEQTYDLMSQHLSGAALLDVQQLTGLPPTTMDRYRLGEHVGKLAMGHERNLRLAILGEEPYVEPSRFIETVARNRAASLRVFTDEDEAHAWLIGGHSADVASEPPPV